MSAPALSVATWNMEWKKPGSRAAELMLERLADHGPHILCLTEAYGDVLDHLGGHKIEAEANYGYPLIAGRRKVLLWSREPWDGIDDIGDPTMPTGRYIAGRTNTPLGEVTVIGVCVPWRDAHVRTGRRDREPWEDHCTYLAGLERVIAQSSGPLIVVGDFNQRVPRTRSPLPVYSALTTALGSQMKVATQGPLAPLGFAAIDHVALSGELAADTVTALDHRDGTSGLISDHFGVAVKVRLASGPERD